MLSTKNGASLFALKTSLNLFASDKSLLKAGLFCFRLCFPYKILIKKLFFILIPFLCGNLSKCSTNKSASL